MLYPIYLDYNATTPCDERVLQEMLPFFTRDFGNAASKSHAYGWVAEEAVDIARERAAALINADPAEMVFTSGSTEAVNLAMRGVYETYQCKGRHVITCAIEHKAVLDTSAYLEKIGAEVTVLPVQADGAVEPAAIEKAIRPDTILISIMYANNETGVVQPVKDIAAIAKKHGVIFFSDATQAVGKIPVDVRADGIDLLCFSAHKMYGPKGVGALYVRRKDPRVKLSPLQYGGGHERGMRSGTLNVPGIVGLGKACEIAASEMATDAERLGAMRNRLMSGILEIRGTALNGSAEHLLPHCFNVSFPGLDAQVMISRLNKHLAVSSGSACTSATLEPSYVLRALGIGDEAASGSLRFSIGKYTTDEEIARALEHIMKAVSS